MVEHVALYILSSGTSSGEAVLANIRASDFIDEINSGEGPREDCGLYKLVQLVTPPHSLKSESDVLKFHTRLVKGEEKAEVEGQACTWNPLCVLIADGKDEEVVEVLQLKEGSVEERLKSKARSAVEVASNVSVANMSIQEYKDMCGNAEVYDAGQ
ncbi:hypothetical protein PSEUBRA_005283 [Kalmanozyma brasiliensis GHG001]|uniref:uncharacterized protein n=1 Tax=Kalmanozyma brasiliensis (strain GHG001) TaxID=1365824 RepID=UPI00286827C8|nr:uncharacterized protein PSEUBRA_005283 [Kalmanozyma brasiliensis GHG001]KAF6767501.1 hypothetical protein PSEUBRA_005283 [Kalmanozyma brasiliensis GHG001]